MIKLQKENFMFIYNRKKKKKISLNNVMAESKNTKINSTPIST